MAMEREEFGESSKQHNTYFFQPHLSVSYSFNACIKEGVRYRKA